MARLADMVTIVTGAARGMGRAVARAYAAEGAAVYAVDVVEDELEQIVAELQRGGRHAVAVPADVANPDVAESVAAQVREAAGRINCLANIAGVISYQPIEETAVAEWDRIIDINLKGTFLFARAVAPTMKAQGSGSIINVSSRAGAMGFADLTAYCASKFGVEGLSRALALELAPHGVAVNTITPGTPVHTAMSEITYTPDKREIWKDPAVITPAFIHLARQSPDGLNDQYVNAWALSEQLRSEGWT